MQVSVPAVPIADFGFRISELIGLRFQISDLRCKTAKHKSEIRWSVIGTDFSHFNVIFASAVAPVITSVARKVYVPAGSLSAEGKTIFAAAWSSSMLLA